MRFIDLVPTISKDLHLTSTETSGCDAGMSWLDMHPDQAPGRTITKSASRELFESLADRLLTLSDFEQILHTATGITTVAEPEPTNAELLSRDIEKFYDQPQSGLQSYETGMAQFLLEQGWTKVPGGDDE